MPDRHAERSRRAEGLEEPGHKRRRPGAVLPVSGQGVEQHLLFPPRSVDLHADQGEPQGHRGDAARRDRGTEPQVAPDDQRVKGAGQNRADPSQEFSDTAGGRDGGELRAHVDDKHRHGSRHHHYATGVEPAAAGHARHGPAYPNSECAMEITPGPTMITSRAGNRQVTSGNMIFTGTFCARSSARWRRRTRISADCSRSTRATGMPSSPACTRAPTNARNSGTVVLATMPRSAWVRDSPICISCSVLANSSASGPLVLRATCASAPSKPRPASTQTVIMSSASGSADTIRACRLMPAL